MKINLTKEKELGKKYNIYLAYYKRIVNQKKKGKKLKKLEKIYNHAKCLQELIKQVVNMEDLVVMVKNKYI